MGLRLGCITFQGDAMQGVAVLHPHLHHHHPLMGCGVMRCIALVQPASPARWCKMMPARGAAVVPA